MVLISIEGNIGSGKSTLVKKIREKFPHVVIVDEPVEEWASITDSNGVGILERYYSDQKRWAFAFQMMAFITRAKRLINIDKNAIVITERSVFTDREIFAKMLFDAGKIEDIEYSIYLKWFDELSKGIKVDQIIYMNTPPEVCCDRVISRGRKGESIPLEYLQDCHKYHEEWMSHETSVIMNPSDEKLNEIFGKKLISFVSSPGIGKVPIDDERVWEYSYL